MRQYLKSVTPAYWDAKERAAKSALQRCCASAEAQRNIHALAFQTFPPENFSAPAPMSRGLLDWLWVGGR